MREELVSSDLQAWEVSARNKMRETRLMRLKNREEKGEMKHMKCEHRQVLTVQVRSRRKGQSKGETVTKMSKPHMWELLWDVLYLRDFLLPPLKSPPLTKAIISGHHSLSVPTGSINCSPCISSELNQWDPEDHRSKGRPDYTAFPLLQETI